MKITELIIELQETLKNYGDIEIQISVLADNGRWSSRAEGTQLEHVDFNGKLRNVLEIRD